MGSQVVFEQETIHTPQPTMKWTGGESTTSTQVLSQHLKTSAGGGNSVNVRRVLASADLLITLLERPQQSSSMMKIPVSVLNLHCHKHSTDSKRYVGT
jgi:hypothetical protein